MNSSNSIEVRNVKKSFKVFYDKGFELKEKILFKNRNKYEKREVLKGISFDIKKGEAVGLIGKNGCGKSTILKMLNRIMYPDSGKIEVQGRVSSLIELGAGFHPDMSGRENIYINASIFGLNRKEIDKRLEQIITFSELEQYIDNPVRTYSSGMYMRLAFSVAINVDADILMIDEILGVGDVSFQTKCFNKLMEIKEKGTTIVIVSHSLEQIEKFCDRSIWIEDGFIRESGIPKEIHQKYQDSMENSRQNRIKAEREKSTIIEKKKLPMFCCKNARRYGNHKMEFSKISLQDILGNEKEIFSREEDIVISYEIDAKYEKEKINIAFRILREDGVTCFASDYATKENFKTGIVKKFIYTEQQSKGKIILDNKAVLIAGLYYLDLVISREGIEIYDEICRVKEFRIEGEASGIGIVEMNVNWQIDQED